VAVVSYLLPFLVDGSPPPTAIGSVTVAVPVCVLVGEVLARQVARLEQSRAAAVAQSEHEQAVVDVLADGVLVLAPDGTVRSCNDAAATLLGVARSELVGARPPIEVGPPGDLLQSTVGARWLETVATVIDSTGERVVAVRDVSRHRALDEAKDLFLATTSHELRTPLTAIKGYVHVLQRRWDVLDDTRRQAALATVAERTDALVALTEHLLLGARAGAARHSADTRPFELCAALTHALRGDTVSGRHRLELDLPTAPLVALGDPVSLEHIVGQLVENAVKYSPSGGTVCVSARQEGAYAVVEVTDEGVGIPDGDGDALFAPFFQAGDTNTREYGGVGLGLYIVRQLVEAQGGTVGAAQRPGGGTVVRFTVPLSAQAAVRPELGAPEDRARAS
jgi:signal transduction histidine kinase